MKKLPKKKQAKKTVYIRQVLTEKSPYKLIHYLGTYTDFRKYVKVINDVRHPDFYLIVSGKYKGEWLEKIECKTIKSHV
jgi:hypothetical protein